MLGGEQGYHIQNLLRLHRVVVLFEESDTHEVVFVVGDGLLNVRLHVVLELRHLGLVLGLVSGVPLLADLEILGVERCLRVVQRRAHGAQRAVLGIELLDLDGARFEKYGNHGVGAFGALLAYDDRCRHGQFELTPPL